MSTHRPSAADVAFRDAFARGEIAPAGFDHRGHVRLAYTHLCGRTDDEAHAAMRSAITAFLARHGIDATKYHETLTRAWVLAIRHFMCKAGACASADELIERFPELLDSKIMLSHYSTDLLFSPEARARFVEPDKDPIPRY